MSDRDCGSVLPPRQMRKVEGYPSPDVRALLDKAGESGYPQKAELYAEAGRLMDYGESCQNPDCQRPFKEHVNLYCPKTYPNYTMWKGKTWPL